MKYLKTYEKLNENEIFNIGDYVILYSGAFGKIINKDTKIFDTYYEIELYLDIIEEPIKVNYLIIDNIKKKISKEEFNFLKIERKANKYNI